MVDLSAVSQQVRVRGVITGKACIEIVCEAVGACGPVQVLRLCAPADDCCQAELILHAVKCLKSSSHRFRSCDGCGINACLLEDVCIISKADRLCCVRETDKSVHANIAGVRVSCPCAVAHIRKESVPVTKVSVRAADEDIRHTGALILLLQLVLDVDAAAHGFDLYMDACLFFILRSSFLESRINLDLAVYKTKRFAVSCYCRCKSRHHSACNQKG